MGRTGRRTAEPCARENPLLGGEETGEGERPTNISDSATVPVHPALPSPGFPRNRALSRHPMKKLTTTITSANGAASYQPRATPWVHTVTLPPALKGRPIAPIKAETPAIKANRASSRQTRNSPWHPSSRPELPHLRPSAFICGQTPRSRFSRLSRLPSPPPQK